MSVKGEKPFIPFEERMEIVEAIKFVDEVVPQVNYDKMEAWNNLKFDILYFFENNSKKEGTIKSVFSYNLD